MSDESASGPTMPAPSAAPSAPPGALTWNIQAVLAIYVLTIVTAALIGAFIVGEPNLRAALAGAVGGYAAAAMQFYFGSSAGSQRKDELLAQSAPVPPPKP